MQNQECKYVRSDASLSSPVRSRERLMLLLYRTQQNLTVCSQYRPPAAWAGRTRERYPDRTACPSHTPPLWTVKRELFYSSTGANKVPTSNNGEKLHWHNQPDGLFSRTKTKPNGSFLRLSTGKLTFDGRGNQHVEDLGAVAWFDQLIRTERVEVQRAATCLVLCFYNHHDVETVVGKIFSLGHRGMRWCHMEYWQQYYKTNEKKCPCLCRNLPAQWLLLFWS